MPNDPVTEIVTLLRPGTPFSKRVGGAGSWAVRRSDAGRPFYAVILEGEARLAVDGHEPLRLAAGDFVLVPSAHAFTMSSVDGGPLPEAEQAPRVLPSGEVRVGSQEAAVDVRLLVGYCEFGSQDAALLVSLLPQLVHVRGEPRLATLVQLVVDESRAQRPARDLILARLLEVLLIESLRSTARSGAPRGLLCGLADERLAVAIRALHEHPARSWTVARLAATAAMSRSAFFERFSRALGIAPMEYLLSWRMALAKDLLRRQKLGVAAVATRVGYRSASTFSVAFTRRVGIPPARFAREVAASAGT